MKNVSKESATWCEIGVVGIGQTNKQLHGKLKQWWQRNESLIFTYDFLCKAFEVFNEFVQTD